MVSVLVFSGGEIDHPPVFLGSHQGNRFKIGKMYEALTAVVFNQLLWRFTHILISSLVNVRRKYQSVWLTACEWCKLTTVFLDFSIHLNIWQLWGQISPLSCQKGTTIILIPLYNLSFHLWKPFKKSLGTTVFLSWMPFKICNCDEFLCHLSRNSGCRQWPNIPTFFSSSFKMIDHKRLKNVKNFRGFFFEGIEISRLERCM